MTRRCNSALSIAGSALLATVAAVAGCGGDEHDIGSTASALDISKFVLPSLSAAARAKIVHKYNVLDPGNAIPRGLLEDAMIYFDVNAKQISKKAYFVVVDLSLYSGKNRFWLVNLSSGAVEAHKVAHGSGSDPNNDGYATLFGNKSGSYMSSLGFALTAEIFNGTHPHSMRLDGLSPDGSPNGMANTNMRVRGIIVHEAAYVHDSNSGKQGMSQGCFALDSAIANGVVNKTQGGSLLYAAKSPLNAPVGRSKCGDGMCDGAETSKSCPADCAPKGPQLDAGSKQPGLDGGVSQPGVDRGSGQPGVDGGPAVDSGSSQPGADGGSGVANVDARIDGGQDDRDVDSGCSVGGGGGARGDGGAAVLLAVALLGRRRRRRR